jgi:hypothetical protein
VLSVVTKSVTLSLDQGQTAHPRIGQRRNVDKRLRIVPYAVPVALEDVAGDLSHFDSQLQVEADWGANVEQQQPGGIPPNPTAAADELRANSRLAANQYRVPVLGLIFHAVAEHRFEQVRPELESRATLRKLVTPDDYRARSLPYIPEQARLSYLSTCRRGSSPAPIPVLPILL